MSLSAPGTSKDKVSSEFGSLCESEEEASNRNTILAIRLTLRLDLQGVSRVCKNGFEPRVRFVSYELRGLHRLLVRRVFVNSKNEINVLEQVR